MAAGWSVGSISSTLIVSPDALMVPVDRVVDLLIRDSLLAKWVPQPGRVFEHLAGHFCYLILLRVGS